jgi:hypothetical protein
VKLNDSIFICENKDKINYLFIERLNNDNLIEYGVIVSPQKLSYNNSYLINFVLLRNPIDNSCKLKYFFHETEK